MSVDLSVPEHVREAAERWQEAHSYYWKSRSLLLGWVGDHGPIRLQDGRLCGFQPDGFQFDADAVKEIMPALIKSGEIAFQGSQADCERLLSLALEEVPDMSFAVKLTVDATAANAVIRAGGEAADRLLPTRVAKNRLGVR